MVTPPAGHKCDVKQYALLVANHISLVDRQEHACQTGAVILDVLEAARYNQPLR